MRSISFSLMLIAMVFCGSCEVENGDVETSSRYVGGEDAERVSMDDPLYAQLERAMTSIFWKGTEDFLCSGIAISPYHILTAAHCVIDDWGEEEDPGDFDFYFGPGFQQFKHPGSGIAIFLPPDIDMDKADPDIAIIWLEESINRENDPWIPDGGKGYISPSRWMTVYSENWDDYSFSYDEWTPVVFGYGNNTDYEISYSNGVLYRGIGGDISCCSYKPQIEDSYNPFVLANEEDEHYLNVFSEENYNWFIWDGDSGGPLFIKNPFKNEYRLAGIVSSGNRVKKTQTFTKVNDFRGWIFQTVYPKADPWNYYSEDTDGDWIMDNDPVETDIDGDGVKWTPKTRQMYKVEIQAVEKGV